MVAGTSATRPWLVVAAILSASAGAIHMAAFGLHNGTGLLGVLIGAAGLAQVAVGIMLLVSHRRLAVLGCALINAGSVLAWVASRTVGLPLPGVSVEAVGIQDAVCAALGAGAFVASLACLASWARAPDFRVVGLASLLAVVAVFAPSEHDLVDQSVPVLEAGRLSERLPLPEAIALLGLSARPPLAGAESHSHSNGTGHGNGFQEPPPVMPLDGQDQALFDEQWSAAIAAADALVTLEAAEAAGYRQASTEAPGLGAHWVKWSLVDKPFDPAHPSMLLFRNRRDGQPPDLVGFSYWVASAAAPEGFVGPNDHWHAHQGMCFIDGWLREERIEKREDCVDTWIEGSDLWMLHAWPVPGAPNRWGFFADMNPALCGVPRQTPDIMRCDPDSL